MLSFIREFRRRREASRRLLFRFFDGRRWRRIDPQLAWRRLVHNDKIDLEKSASDLDAGAEPETTTAIEVICEVFGVERFNDDTGRGLTDNELFGLLISFNDWIVELKKNTSPGPTSSAPTESNHSAPLEPQDSPTNPSSDCGSMPTESKHVEQSVY